MNDRSRLAPLFPVLPGPAREYVPQFYRSSEATIRDAHPLLTELLRRAREAWGEEELTLESQTVDLDPGAAPGLPVWHRLPSSSSGEVLLACLADSPLVRHLPEDAPGSGAESNAACAARVPDVIDGRALSHEAATFLPAGATVRFVPSPVRQTACVVLVRPRDGAWLLDRRRTCARRFEADPKRRRGPDVPWARDRSLEFDSTYDLEATLPTFSRDVLEREVLMAGARVRHARANGGPIVRAFVDAMPQSWRDDGETVMYVTRLDELSPGWWPTLTEWHLDGVGRSVRTRADGSPDFRDPESTTEQRCACIGPTAPTSLLVGRVRLPEPPLGLPAGQRSAVWNGVIAEQLARGDVHVEQVPAGKVFRFGWGAFHATSRSTRPGWRYFLKSMRGRNWTPPPRVLFRSHLSWDRESGAWPEDPCGVFPASFPGMSGLEPPS